MRDEEHNQGAKRTVFGERFEFEGLKYIVVAEAAEGFVLAVKAEDEAPALLYLLPAPRAEVVNTPQESLVSQPLHSSENQVLLWTSGSCLGNPGPGGWAYVRQEGDGVLAVASGGEMETSMMRMKIRAVIEALNALPQRGLSLVLYSDSQSVIKAMAEGLLPKTDRDLWEELKRAASGLPVTWQELGAVSGRPEHDRCNRLAEAAAIHQARSGGRPNH